MIGGGATRETWQGARFRSGCEPLRTFDGIVVVQGEVCEIMTLEPHVPL
jgi:hypothetical protein